MEEVNRYFFWISMEVDYLLVQKKYVNVDKESAFNYF